MTPATFIYHFVVQVIIQVMNHIVVQDMKHIVVQVINSRYVRNCAELTPEFR